MEKTQVIKINFPAGIVSPGALLLLLQLASTFHVKDVQFGSRQQLLLSIPKKDAASFAAQCAGKNMTVSMAGHASENMISSYAAAGIFITESWLSQGVYKDVFDLFHYTPKLKININDAAQTFVPLFTGNLNWIASPHVHYWYLYVRFPKTNNVFRWPELIYTNNIGAVSKSIEKFIAEEKITNSATLLQAMKSASTYIAKKIEQELRLPKFHLPYYEGFNAVGNAFWLGLYRRDECFSIAFLKDLCAICLQTKISEIYITSWKTLIIKGIEKTHRALWDNVLGRHRINVRHAANELAWLVDDDCEDGLILKRHIIRYFDKEDVRTYGLCFAIKVKPEPAMFGSVIIRKEEAKNTGRSKTSERFAILYTQNFNPNCSEVIEYRQGVKKEFLGPYLVSLCKQFYEEEEAPMPLLQNEITTTAVKDSLPKFLLYQCRHCLTVYDETLGDPGQQIVASTGFHQLPQDYICPLCEAPLEDFGPVTGEKIHTT